MQLENPEAIAFSPTQVLMRLLFPAPIKFPAQLVLLLTIQFKYEIYQSFNKRQTDQTL